MRKLDVPEIKDEPVKSKPKPSKNLREMGTLKGQINIPNGFDTAFKNEI